jgi:nucleoside-diphosphate-sugar epimerase
MTAPEIRTPLRIAILGAGYVGGALARAASARGHEVWAVRRSVPAPAADGVHWLRGAIASGVIEGVPDALDAVVLTIAPSSADSYDDTYPPAAAAALALAARTRARTLIYTSSSGVYGGSDGVWVTEQSPRLGAGEGNSALIAAEDVLLSARARGVCVLRVAGIYGPGRDPRSRMRTATALPQQGQYWVNLAHRDDIVSAALHVLALPNPPAVLNVADGSPTRAADVSRWLAQESGTDPESLVFGNTAQRSRNDQRVSTSALVATGWSPEYPSFREGFRSGL